MFRNVHPINPDMNGGPIRSDAVNTGRNAEGQPLFDDRYVRCRQCGFICHLDRDMHANEDSVIGDGYSQHDTELASAVSVGDTTITVDSTTGFASSGTAYIYDADAMYMMPFDYTGTTSSTFTGCTRVTRAFAIDDIVRDENTVGGGCPQCGSYLYR